MKWVVFALALPFAIFCGLALRGAKAAEPIPWLLLGLSPYLLSAVPLADIGLISWSWRGHTQGITVSLTDLVALCLFIYLLGESSKTYFKIPAAIFLLSIIISIFQTEVPISAIFFLWKALKVCFVMYVVSLGGRRDEVIHWILIGAGVGVLGESLIAFYQHFILHIHQAPGTFPHQNSLGLAMHFAVLPIFAAFLSGRMNWFGAAVTAAGGIIAVSTASRATIGMYAAGITLVFLFSIFRERTSRKIVAGAVGLGLGIVVAALAYQSLQARFAQSPLSTEYDERAALEAAAGMMVRDRPMGVGANNFIIAMNLGGYTERAGVSWSTGSKAVVHNIYWLVAVELGVFGFFAWLVLALSAPARAFGLILGGRTGPDAELIAGLTIALIIVYMHSMFEWILFTDVPFYLMAMTFGMIGAIIAKSATATDLRATDMGPQSRDDEGKIRPDDAVVGVIERSERPGVVKGRFNVLR